MNARPLLLRTPLLLCAALCVSPPLRAADPPPDLEKGSIEAGPAKRSIPKVPTLAWGTDRETTFAGALAAALAPTAHPYDYPTLMGVTGLAFRTRWYQGPKDDRWNGSGPIGEGAETLEAARKATGWELAMPMPDVRPIDSDRLYKAVTAALDAGQAVVSYGEKLDMGVIYGYEGKTLLLYDYDSRGATVRLTVDKIIHPGIIVPGTYGKLLPSKEALLAALKAAVRNWDRKPEGPEDRRYWYGDAAFSHWIDDLQKAGGLKDADKDKLFQANWWNLDSLYDARTAGGKYLNASLALLSPKAQESLKKAMDLYDREAQLASITFARRDVFLGPWTGKTLADWTPEVRENEVRILEKARALEAEAVAELMKVIAAEEAAAKSDAAPKPAD